MTEDTTQQNGARHRSRPTDDVAIVGMACLFPKAPDLQTFWIDEIPLHRFDWRDYFDPDENARDKIYTKVGGFIDEVPFDPVEFGIPPNAVEAIEPSHLLTLAVVRAALRDAGYESREFPRATTSVILGTGSGSASATCCARRCRSGSDRAIPRCCDSCRPGPRTRFPASCSTSSRGASPTASTSAASTTRWTPPARPR